MAAVTNDSRTWLEVIDPKTGVKIDVAVSIHARFINGMIPGQVIGRHLDIAGRVAEALGHGGFTVSDREDRLDVTPSA